jgi:hypothetical protein
MGDYRFGPEGPSWNGIPLTGNGVPLTFGNTANQGAGRYYYVNPTIGSDGNKGLSMERPFATIEKAHGLLVNGNHDTIVLSATSEHSQSGDGTDEITLTKGRTHWQGLDAVGRYSGQRSRITMGDTTASGGAIAILQNTGVGNTFRNIKFDSSDTESTSLYTFADGGEYTAIINCEFVKTSDLDQTTSGIFLNNADTGFYYGCTFGSLVASHQVSVNRPCMKMNRTTITGKVCRAGRIEKCTFLISTSSTDAAMIHGTGATDVERYLIIDDCTFINDVLGSANCDQAIEFDSALTQAYVLVTGMSAEVGCTAFSTTTGVFVNSPVASATSVSAVQAS